MAKARSGALSRIQALSKRLDEQAAAEVVDGLMRPDDGLAAADGFVWRGDDKPAERADSIDRMLGRWQDKGVLSGDGLSAARLLERTLYAAGAWGGAISDPNRLPGSRPGDVGQRQWDAMRWLAEMTASRRLNRQDRIILDHVVRHRRHPHAILIRPGMEVTLYLRGWARMRVVEALNNLADFAQDYMKGVRAVIREDA